MVKHRYGRLFLVGILAVILSAGTSLAFSASGSQAAGGGKSAPVAQLNQDEGICGSIEEFLTAFSGLADEYLAAISGLTTSDPEKMSPDDTSTLTTALRDFLNGALEPLPDAVQSLVGPILLGLVLQLGAGTLISFLPLAALLIDTGGQQVEEICLQVFGEEGTPTAAGTPVG